MRKLTLAALLGMSLLLAVPAIVAAHPGEGHHKDGNRHERHQPEADWSAYPADFQSYKNQLEQLKEQQRGLFEQFKQQREAIKSAHQKLPEAKRKELKANVQDLIVELKTTRNTIHTLSDQKAAAWEQFEEHTAAKQWDAAKIDIQTVISRKQEIIAKQRTILETQQKIFERMKK
jgi:L-rhamnose mutarotase